MSTSDVTDQPTPPPLCSATHVAPRKLSPIQFCTAMSAHSNDPSSMLDVSRYGLSVPLTSWWSRLTTTGPWNNRPVMPGQHHYLKIPYRTASHHNAPHSTASVFRFKKNVAVEFFSQPSIYIDGWLYGMRMTSVTFRCCLKTIPHIIILS